METNGAEERTRTSKEFPPQVPETCVSTNFTTSAFGVLKNLPGLLWPVNDTIGT